MTSAQLPEFPQRLSDYDACRAALTILLIVYQLFRWRFTHRTVLMRDTEERSGVSPPMRSEVTWSWIWPFRDENRLGYWDHYVWRQWFLQLLKLFALRAYEFLFLTHVVMPV